MDYIPAKINVRNFIDAYRNIGYSIETAVSDIIDNSISARATEISVYMEWKNAITGEPQIRILDNGCGMMDSELIQAMQLACKSPLDVRNPEDLGRFGLGLKSASFSQCKMLTVISRKEGNSTCGKVWDIEHVRNTGKFEIGNYNEKAFDEYIPYSTGTIVIWDKLDRLNLPAGGDSEKTKKFWKTIRSKLYTHIAITYGDYKGKIKFKFNENEIELWDPFHTDNESTNLVAEESISISNGNVVLRAYTLPLDLEDEKIVVSLGKTMSEMQGFYIYRNTRLILYGTWLGLPGLNRNEAYRLARIRIDIGNELDDLWNIDIKKENATCPPVLIEKILAYAKKAREESSGKFRSRGKTIKRRISDYNETSYIWTYGINKEKKPYYSINLKSPLIREFIKELDSSQRNGFLRIIKCLENYLPVMSLLEQESKAGGKYISNDVSEFTEEEIKFAFDHTVFAIESEGKSHSDAVCECLYSEPFINYWALLKDKKENDDV